MSDSKSPIEKAKEALRPFANVIPSSFFPFSGSDKERYLVVLAPEDEHDFTGEDLRRAREALKALEGE